MGKGICHLIDIIALQQRCNLLVVILGDKFYQFLFYFSTYILKQKMHVLPSKFTTVLFTFVST